MPGNIGDFYKEHAGETGLIVCNGPSLGSMPVEFLTQYPSIGCNSIVMWDKFRPTYYCTGDDRVRREFGTLVNDKYHDIPKFIPDTLHKWQGDNFFRWFWSPGKPWADGYLEGMSSMKNPGIVWRCAPHIMMQLAFYMGFTTLLVVGMDHSDDRREHPWWYDHEMPGDPNRDMWSRWEDFTAELHYQFKLRGVDMFNVTPDTNEKALPKRDWMNFMNGPGYGQPTSPDSGCDNWVYVDEGDGMPTAVEFDQGEESAAGAPEDG